MTCQWQVISPQSTLMDLQEAKQLACELMDKHGLLDEGWCFEYSNAKRQFGVCQYRNKTIKLSHHLVGLNDIERVKDTILHEIAHALVGSEHGHDHVWKAKAIEIGCNGERCYSEKDTIVVKGKYVATCVGCGTTYRKFKNPRRGYWCKCDKRKFVPEAKLIWKLEN